MSLVIPYDQSRQKMIRAKMRAHEEAAGGEARLPHSKLIIKGQAVLAPVYRMDWDDLAFNKSNGRIKAEVLEKEAEVGKFLEDSNPEHQAIIKDILLKIRPDENNKISEDLKKSGQLNPGIITCDGKVINGNRRKALLEELYQTTGKDQFKYLDVQVLPCDITKAELWLIEAGIQLSAPQQLDYSPINHLLKLREGINSGLSTHVMAARIYGVSEETIKSDLERLKLIDEYLKDFLGKPERYYLVNQLNEHFIDLQGILNWAKRPRGVAIDWQPDASDKNELKIVGFYYIRNRYPHMRIRELRDLFVTKQSWQNVRQSLKVSITLSAEECQNIGLQPAAKQPDSEDIDMAESVNGEKTSTFTTPIEEKDFQEETCWRELHKDELKNFYEDAKEQKQIVKDSQRPLTLAKRALKMIEAIPVKKEMLEEPEIDKVLHQIITRTNELRKVIRKQRPKKGGRG